MFIFSREQGERGVSYSVAKYNTSREQQDLQWPIASCKNNCIHLLPHIIDYLVNLHHLAAHQMFS